MNERVYYSEEAKNQARRRQSLLVLFSLSLGLGIGSALALLFAPKDGDSIREDVAGAMQKRLRTAEQQISEIRSKLENRISDLT